MMRTIGLCGGAVWVASGVLSFLCTPAIAQLSLQPAVTSGVQLPLFVTAPANDSRLFIVEKTGRIMVQQAPNTTPTVFLSLGTGGANIVNAQGERGLLGMAFDPNFATNNRFYVYYIDSATLDTTVARYTVPNPSSNTANTTGEIILTVDQPSEHTNHKAGWIGFRPGEPNNLYIATGDGGGSNDPNEFADNLNVSLGKILRVDVSGNGPGYAIPAGNPFAGATPGNDEIWAYGLRNPFRNSFDRDTGHFYIADVGQSTREEVNVEETTADAGRHYGWDAREGSGDNPGVSDPDPGVGVRTDPVFDYVHATNPFAPPAPNNPASITGGYVYRGNAIPSLDGTYFFADFVADEIGSFVYNPNTNSVSQVTHWNPILDPTNTLFGGNSISSFGEDGFGELYVVDIGGQVYKLVPEPAGLVLLSFAALAASRRARRRQHV